MKKIKNKFLEKIMKDIFDSDIKRTIIIKKILKKINLFIS